VLVHLPARSVAHLACTGLTRAALAIALGGCLLGGCASKPVVYGGGAVAQADIDECRRLARQAGAGNAQGREIAKDTAVGAAMGGAATGVYGAVRGYSNVGNRTAAGAAAGATVGLIRGATRASEPSDTFKRYVDRCLRERGYDVVGWN
jgi:outer membrane lipoprotein SlyB